MGSNAVLVHHNVNDQHQKEKKLQFLWMFLLQFSAERPLFLQSSPAYSESWPTHQGSTRLQSRRSSSWLPRSLSTCHLQLCRQVVLRCHRTQEYYIVQGLRCQLG